MAASNLSPRMSPLEKGLLSAAEGDNRLGLFAAVVDRLEETFASIVLARHCPTL